MKCGYYRIIKPLDDIPVGETVCVYSITDAQVLLTYDGTDYEFEHDEFNAEFVDETGQARLIEALSSIEELQRDLDNTPSCQLSITAGKDSAAVVNPETFTELKKDVALARNKIAKMKNEIERRSRHLAKLLEEQASLMRQKAEELEKKVEAANEFIWTVNLYLGQSETIVQIRKGKPAPIDTKISIRQLVLFMDEECAVAAEKGGIDIKSVGDFDTWLLKSEKHLAQVFPEEKGLVAMRLRRSNKSYENQFDDLELNKFKDTTYFLLRNGENLYRFTTNYIADNVLFPTQTEFMDMLYEDNYDYQQHRTVKTPLVPGSDTYMKKMEKIDAKRRHYYRACLIIQGLFDRTDIFKPIYGERLNVCDFSTHDEALNFIYDAETHKLLTTLRPPFREWLKSVNSKLDVGQRVVGIFNNWEYGLGRIHSKGECYRLWPTKHMSLPDDLALHTIQDKKRSDLYIYYSRTIVSFGQYGAESKTRGRCSIRPDDGFIIAFDQVSKEDMEYYLSSRLNRVSYAHMFPLLKKVIALKEEEAKTEAPFLKLLASQIAKAHSVSIEQASGAISELVTWWKFKNKTHRALTKDDKLAIKMIVSEFNVRRKRVVERLGLTDEFQSKVIDFALSINSQIMYVGHKGKNEYVAYAPIEDRNIFVTEYLFKANRSTSSNELIRLHGQKNATTLTTRHQRYKTIFETDRWKSDWKIHANKNNYLTPKEQEWLLNTAITFFEDPEWPEYQHRRWKRSDCGKFVLLYARLKPATTEHSDLIEVYYVHSFHKSGRDAATRASRNLVGPKLGIIHVGYKLADPNQPADGRELKPILNHSWDKREIRDIDSLPFQASDIRILKDWPDAQAKLRQSVMAYEALVEEGRKLWGKFVNLRVQVEKQIKAHLTEIAKLEYLEELGDIELWPERLGKLEIKYDAGEELTDLIWFCAEKNLITKPMSVGEALEIAKKHGAKVADNAIADHELKFMISPAEDDDDQ